METCIYFDNAATTFPKPEEVYTAMDRVNRQEAVNAGRGSYALARKAAALISDTRKAILKLAEADEVAEVVFTASATLASNQIFGGLEWSSEDVVYVTPYEHNAIVRVLYALQKKYHFEIVLLERKEESLELDLEKIQFQFSRKPPTVLVMTHVSNTIGAIVPVKELADLAKKYNAITVVDGAQALGLIPVSLKQMQIDFYIFAGHKTLYGPFGIGGFIRQKAVKLQPYLAGGTGSDSLNPEMFLGDVPVLEAGSPNLVAIAGLHAAVQTLHPEELLQREQELTAYLTTQLRTIPRVILYTPHNHVGIVAFNLEGYQSADVGMILDEDYNIAVRTGYQCAPYIHDVLEDKEHLGIVRASIGRYTTREEIDSLVKAVREIAEE